MSILHRWRMFWRQLVMACWVGDEWEKQERAYRAYCKRTEVQQ